MKHTDREQQIANGLKRGELLVTLDCGCTVIQDRTADAYIIYCSKHAAAPDLLEACQAIMKAISGMQWYDEGGDAIKLVKAAIAKATE